MNTITKFDLTPFTRNTIGFDRVFDLLDRQFANSTTNVSYPPYNILKTGEDSYQIEIAVAGFREDELDVSVKDYVLTVKGEQNRNDDDSNYIHKGISARAFTRTFTLGDHVEVRAATVQNGLLVIDLLREVPEEAKPRKIAITFQK